MRTEACAIPGAKQDNQEPFGGAPNAPPAELRLRPQKIAYSVMQPLRRKAQSEDALRILNLED
jgi:hypothetical protein